jgi:hypothetical protein
MLPSLSALALTDLSDVGVRPTWQKEETRTRPKKSIKRPDRSLLDALTAPVRRYAKNGDEMFKVEARGYTQTWQHPSPRRPWRMHPNDPPKWLLFGGKEYHLDANETRRQAVENRSYLLYEYKKTHGGAYTVRVNEQSDRARVLGKMHATDRVQTPNPRGMDHYDHPFHSGGDAGLAEVFDSDYNSDGDDMGLHTWW